MPKEHLQLYEFCILEILFSLCFAFVLKCEGQKYSNRASVLDLYNYPS